jgi:hypothetical protein
MSKGIILMHLASRLNLNFVWPPAVYTIWTVACPKIGVRTEKQKDSEKYFN